MVSEAPLPQSLSDPKEALEQERHIMAAYCDTAKTYSQLSIGALVLSITFFEKVLKYTNAIPVTRFLVVAWIGWLVTAIAGSFYQYLAVRFLESRGEDWKIMIQTGHPQLFRWLSRNPWLVYGAMLIAFMIGSISFAVVGIFQLS